MEKPVIDDFVKIRNKMLKVVVSYNYVVFRTLLCCAKGLQNSFVSIFVGRSGEAINTQEDILTAWQKLDIIYDIHTFIEDRM